MRLRLRAARRNLLHKGKIKYFQYITTDFLHSTLVRRDVEPHRRRICLFRTTSYFYIQEPVSILPVLERTAAPQHKGRMGFEAPQPLGKWPEAARGHTTASAG